MQSLFRWFNYNIYTFHEPLPKDISPWHESEFEDSLLFVLPVIDHGVSSSPDATLVAFPSSIFSQSSTFSSLNQTFWVRKRLYCNYNEHWLGNGVCLSAAETARQTLENYVMQHEPTTWSPWLPRAAALFIRFPDAAVLHRGWTQLKILDAYLLWISPSSASSRLWSFGRLPLFLHKLLFQTSLVQLVPVRLRRLSLCAGLPANMKKVILPLPMWYKLQSIFFSFSVNYLRHLLKQIGAFTNSRLHIP